MFNAQNKAIHGLQRTEPNWLALNIVFNLFRVAVGSLSRQHT